jgi:tungstate transport system permease protein
MELIWEGIVQAFELLLSLDAAVLEITLVSLKLSGLATIISLLIGLPLGTLLALGRFPTRRFMLSTVNTGLALPPVVVGLSVSIFVIAQVIISAPIVTGLTVAGIQQLDPRLQIQLLGLGASRPQMILLLWREARLPLLAALMAGFGAVISEVGAVMMVGGNILNHTRVLTTAIVLETSKGEFAPAIALSVVLLLVAFMVNFALTWIQQRSQ